MPATPTTQQSFGTSNRSSNRFSSDFSSFDVRLLSSTSFSNKSACKNGNTGDLHSFDHRSPYDRTTAACVATVSNGACETNCAPHVNAIDAQTNDRATPLRSIEEGEAATNATEITENSTLNRGTNKQSTFSRDRLFNGNVSSTAHTFFDFIKFKRNSESNCNQNSDKQQSELLQSTTRELVDCRGQNCSTGKSVASSEDAMRLNVPAANSIGIVDGVNTSATIEMPTMNNKVTMNAIHENGTVIGAIQSHPSLTIQVNQNANNNISMVSNESQASVSTVSTSQCITTFSPPSASSSITQQNIVNQSTGVSIVNCYRAVPVQIVHSENDESQIVQIVNDQMQSNHVTSELSSEKYDSTVFRNQIRNDDLVNALDNTINSTNELSISAQNCRTFTSTEAQTDDLQPPMDVALIENVRSLSPVVVVPTPVSAKSNESRRGGNGSSNHGIICSGDPDVLSAREQRRRERRERRAARNNARQQHMHANQLLHPHHGNCEILPDILHSHIPPPYTTLPMPPHCQISAAAAAAGSPPASVLLPAAPSALITPIPFGIDDGRYSFPLPIMRR